MGGQKHTAFAPGLNFRKSIILQHRVADWRVRTTISYQVRNAGNATAGASTADVVLFDTAGDYWVVTPSPWARLPQGPLVTENATITLPAAVGAGTYYVAALADATFQVAKSNDENNSFRIHSS